MTDGSGIPRLFWLIALASVVGLVLLPGPDESRESEAAPARPASGSGTLEASGTRAAPEPGTGPGAGAGGDAGTRLASALPCDVPLAWRIGEIDDRFELSRSEVETAVRRAADSWERAAGRSLFSHDPDRGLPIRLVYDERQRSAEESWRRQREMERSMTEIEAERSELRERREELDRAWAGHRARVDELNRSIRTHNDTVNRWNERGDAPVELLDRLRESREAFESEQDALETLAEELRERERRLATEEDRLGRMIDEHNRRSERAGRSRPTSVQAGMYSEHAHMRGQRLLSVSDRRIDIFMFPGREGLSRVMAHELGHALGLGHAPDSSAVMSEVYFTDGAGSGPEIHPADLALLRSTCPDL